MTTFGVCMVKDEVDVVAQTVGHMLTQVDEVIVADNGSTDGTRDVLVDLGVHVLFDDEVAYYQSRKMSRLAATAADLGAEWVVPFDSDELWYSPFGRIADVLAERHHDAIVTADLYDHVATGADLSANVPPVERLGYRRIEAAPLPKVACRARPAVTIHQGNHGASYGDTSDGLIVRHYPYRSAEQMVKKVRNGAAAYAASDLPEDQGKHWRDYGRILDTEGEEGVKGIFRAWFFSPDPERDSTLTYDPAPL